MWGVPPTLLNHEERQDVDVASINLSIRARKVFIFYNYQEGMKLLGADDVQKLGLVFIESTPVNIPLSR